MKLSFKNILFSKSNITYQITETRRIILFGSLVILLNLVIIFPTSALSYQSNEPLSFTFAPTVQITISDNLTIPSLSPGDGKDSNIITVTASSNAMSGYTLSSTVGDSTTYPTNELRKDGTNTTYKFTNLISNTDSLTNFHDNEWGYSYSTDSGTTWQSGDITGTPALGYDGLPLYTTETPITLINSTNASTNSVQFKIGARAASTQAAGEYTNVVNFIGVANPNPEPRTLDQVTYMQDNFSCILTPTGTTKTLIDKRDNQEYLVSKLKDGRCWMLENLRLDPTDATTRANMLANNDTNASNEAIANYFNPSGTAPQTGWSTVAVADVDTGFSSYTDPMINNASVDTLVTSYGPAASGGKAKVGIYYNYCAATVGTYCYAASASTGDASYDICPANWHMPTGGASGEYQSLCNAVYGGECTNSTSMTGTSPNSLQYVLSTPLSGYYGGSQATGHGSYGNFWSSTRSIDNDMYSLHVDSSSVNPQSSYGRSGGFSVRCVAGS